MSKDDICRFFFENYFNWHKNGRVGGGSPGVAGAGRKARNKEGKTPETR